MPITPTTNIANLQYIVTIVMQRFAMMIVAKDNNNPVQHYSYTYTCAYAYAYTIR